MTASITILTGHVSPETAYTIESYPYGFRLRCQIRYWLECHKTHGVRMCSQTTNPKKGGVWNKPKASTYSRFAAAMYLDDDGHVHQSGLTEYTDGAEAAAWRDKFGAGVPEAARYAMDQWVATKLAYDAARTPDAPLSQGLKEAREAFFTTAIAQIKARESQQDEDAMNDFNYVGSRHHY